MGSISVTEKASAGVLGRVPSECQQVMLVTESEKKGFYSQVSFWERSGNHWQKRLERPAVIGRNGLVAPAEKQEGDGKTPQGLYRLARAFGYDLSIKTGLAYRQATENDYWVDDPSSSKYNQWVAGKPQGISAESMRRQDDQYRWGAVIEYNTNPIVAGKGSAIFFHVWRSPEHPTAGCVAMDAEDVQKILGLLDCNKKPVILIQ